MKALVGAKRRGAPWLALLLVLGFLAAGCGGSGNSASKPAAGPATSAATSPPASTGLAPNSAGPYGHCLVGTKPWNIEISGTDAAKTCDNLRSKFADLGYPNQPVHAYAPPGDPNFVELRPAGYTTGCYLTYPLDLGVLNAMVSGYVGRAFDASDPGPIAKSVCDRMVVLGWVRAGY